jgi:hypothetical protein
MIVGSSPIGGMSTSPSGGYLGVPASFRKRVFRLPLQKS